MSVGLRLTLSQLMQRHQRVIIPLIQRDYAQGRATEQPVREEFVQALATALETRAGDPSLPLNLDFVYGTVEEAFHPLDGQQRLTTLFLLHWYAAWLDGAQDAFSGLFVDDESSRFSYKVRNSSIDFFDALVRHHPPFSVSETPSVEAWVVDQPWFFRSWRSDPTVQSLLVMLDALHARLARSRGIFARLVDEESPAITFQLLDLDHFGLADDLYIKMNGRGKPLTPFETFKARYEQELASDLSSVYFEMGGQRFPASDYVARRMDTAWADLFWDRRDRSTNSYDGALMQVIRALALVSRAHDSPGFVEDAGKLRSPTLPTYLDFHQRKWLDRAFTLSLVHLFDLWAGPSGKFQELLPENPYFMDGQAFNRMARAGAQVSYVEAVQMAAFARLAVLRGSKVDAGQALRWMRVITNLAVNSGYNRNDDLRRSVAGIEFLLPHAANIEAFLAGSEEAIPGFSEPQVKEERLKAQLLGAHAGWRDLIELAESHGYFRGQIDFLLTFAGLVEAAAERPPAQWTEDKHQALQSRFLRFLRLASEMFDSEGLRDVGHHRWQRALLCMGDYSLTRGMNFSFLVNPVTDDASWKRLLRGIGPDVAAKRDLLRLLWEQLNPDAPLAPQLDAVIARATVSEAWRQALVTYPGALSFCEDSCIRYHEGAYYLLRRTQLNSAHAELRSYCTFLRNENRPRQRVRLSHHHSIDTLTEPFIWVSIPWGNGYIRIYAMHEGPALRLSVPLDPPLPMPLAAWLAQRGFAAAGENLSCVMGHERFDDFVRELDAFAAGTHAPDALATPAA